MQRKLRNLFLLLLAVMPLRAQATVMPETVDSLLKVYQQTADSDKPAVARRLIDLCMDGDQLIDQPLTVRKDMPADSISLLVYFAATRYYYNKAYFAEGLQSVEQALPLSQGNSDILRATLLCDRCYCLFKQGRMKEAAEAGEQAMQFSLTLGPSVYLARAYLYLAIVNHSLPNTEQAKLFVQKAISIDEQVGPNNNTHNIYGIACEIYSVAQEPDKAIEYGQRAVEAARAIGYDEGVVNHLSQLSYAYNRRGDYLRGLETARQAVAFVEQMKVPDRNLLAISLEYEAYNLLDLKRNAEAVPVLLRAIQIEQEVGNRRAVCYDYKALAEAYEPDSPREAIAALRRFIIMNDSIHNVQMEEALGKANAQFHNNELQDEVSLQRRQNHLIIVVSAAIVLLLLAIIAFVIYAYRLRGRINRGLQQQQQVQETFLANVSDEFREPLSVMQGLSEQLKDISAEAAANVRGGKGSGRQREDQPDEKLRKLNLEGLSDEDREFVDNLRRLVVERMDGGETDVEHLAPLLAMSQTQLRRKIIGVTGVSAARFITYLRIEEAKRLLQQYPKVTIIDVAYSTGFADNAHFTKVFHKYTGKTPLQYVRKQQKSQKATAAGGTSSPDNG